MSEVKKKGCTCKKPFDFMDMAKCPRCGETQIVFGGISELSLADRYLNRIVDLKSSHDLAIRKKDLEIQILRDRLYKNLAMSWKDDSEGRNKAYQNINTEIEKAKWEVK